ncbi:methyltransferase domain-containing protein [Candidatus Bathyarchaeota archaeon]|nr:methyltransferase domain-containing protein [Candidatus Bathyarchaeota archaeon]
MIALAEKNKAKAGGETAEFIEAQITNIPLADGIADIAISNCVINLVPEEEKPLVFKEIFRLLKSGGRLAVSDILAKHPLPENVRKCAAAHVGCVAGASLVAEYQVYLKQAGFNGKGIDQTVASLSIFRS